MYATAISNKDKPSMRVHLMHSIRGLESLKKTYEDDTTTVARIETLIEHIKHEVDETNDA